jgi:hypothetical protein
VTSPHFLHAPFLQKVHTANAFFEFFLYVLN